MPFTPDMRRKVDQIRDYLYGGGYPDPLSNAEQLSFLFFILHDRGDRRGQPAAGQGHQA
jgi:hypothetical protein